MKTVRILFIAVALGAMYVNGLSQGEPETKGTEPRKHESEAPKAIGPGTEAASQRESEEGMPPKAREKRNEVRPGPLRTKPARPVPSTGAQKIVEKKQRDDHRAAIGSPGSGEALRQQPIKAPQVFKPAFEIRKTDGRPGPTASDAGAGVVNGSSMNAMLHKSASQTSIGGMTGPKARGAAAVNGTDIQRKP